ncbi:MAG: phosphohydrolase, partial [Thermotogaceae bacterium]|nr:phosphohydrolase [Thermotogaceae bacterium]
RPYRPSLGVEEALAELKKNSGVLYDREVVDALLRVIERGFVFDTDPFE